jgi:hypothetical protein
VTLLGGAPATLTGSRSRENEWVRILCVGGKLIDFARLVSEPLSGSVASG